MKRTTWFVLALGTVLGSSAFGQANFYLQNSIDLGPTGLDVFGGTSANTAGFNPSSVTTDGTDVFIGGWAGSAGNVGVVRLSNAFTGTPTANLMTQTVLASMPAGQGITGLKAQGNQLLVSADYGSLNANGLRSYNAASGALQWTSAVSVRGWGASFDPGFGGTGNGAAVGSIGSGRRIQVNQATGASQFDTTSGLIWFGAPVTGGNLRDMDFDAAGNIYVRSSNMVLSGTRNGANSLSSRTVVVQNGTGNGNGPSTTGQNLALFTNGGGTAILWNDRPDVSGARPPSSFVSTMKANAATGSSIALNWFNADGSAAPTILDGNGFYDFTFTSTGDLLVVDFANRSLYRFATTPVPEPTTMVGLALGGLALLRRRRSSK